MQRRKWKMPAWAELSACKGRSRGGRSDTEGAPRAFRFPGSGSLAAAAAFAAAFAMAAPATAQVSDLVTRNSLRVCADPADMPMSSRDSGGFENKIAELMSEAFELEIDYTWFPIATGWYRNTLGARICDVALNVAAGGDPIQNTNHYYRTAWIFIVREDNEDLAELTALDDPALQGKRVGVIAGTPPASHLQHHGLMPLAQPYPLMVDRRFDSPAEDMIADVALGNIDAGILWGPFAGYYVRESGLPIKMVPLVNETRGPNLAYRMTFGVRPGEINWRHRLNDFIAEYQGELHDILREYNVPLLDENNQPMASVQD